MVALCSKVIDILWVLRSIERIGAHARNIAEQIDFCITGEDVRYQNWVQKDSALNPAASQLNQ